MVGWVRRNMIWNASLPVPDSLATDSFNVDNNMSDPGWPDASANGMIMGMDSESKIIIVATGQDHQTTLGTATTANDVETAATLMSAQSGGTQIMTGREKASAQVIEHLSKASAPRPR